MRGRRLIVPAGDDIRPDQGHRARGDVLGARRARRDRRRGRCSTSTPGTGALGVRVAVAGRGPRRAGRARPGRRSTRSTHNLEHPASTRRRGSCGPTSAASSPRRRRRKRPSTSCSPIRRTNVDDDEVEALLARLADAGWLSPGAMVVVERPARAVIRRCRRGSGPAGNGPSGIRSCVFVEASD